VFRSALKLLSETFLILRRIRRDIAINEKSKVNVKQSRYRPGVAQRVPEI